MSRGSCFLAILMVAMKYGSLNSTPLDDLTLNLNLSKTPEAIETTGQETFEEERELKAGETVEAHAVVIGGVDDKKISQRNVQIYRNDRWEYLEHEMDGRLNSMGAANLEGYLFVAGGREKMSQGVFDNIKDGVLKRGNRFSIWLYDSILVHARAFPTLNEVQIADVRLMVTGGFDSDDNALKSAEIYETNNLWRSTAPMFAERFGHAAAVVGCELHVMGGHPQNITETMFTTEIFDFTTMMWRLGELMNKAREFHAAAVMDGELYTCGGYRMPIGPETERVFHKSCEKLHRDQFIPAEEMKVDRAGFGMVTIGAEIWAIGGFNQAKEALDSVERLTYKPALERREWTPSLAKLKSPRKFFGATSMQIVNSTFV